MTKEKRRHVDGVPSAEATGSPQAGPGPALRRRAEAIAREKAARSPEDLEALSPEEIGRILHELRVHQIELEMQNDELRRAQEELGASRSKYSDLYDMAPVGYFTASEEGVILQANLRGADMLGVERSRLIKQPLGRFIVPEDNDVYYLHCKRVLEKGARQVCELRMRRKDGSPFRGRLETSATRDGMDGPSVFRIILSDITERMRAEEALQQSEERYRVMVQGLPDVVMRFDREGRHLFVSDNVSEKVDLQASQFIGKTHHELGFPEAQCRFWEEAVRKVFDSGAPFETEFTLESKQGPVVNNWRLLPERDAQGMVRSVLSLMRDITERKRAEAEKEKLQAQLQQAMKMEAVGRLAGGVAHDFNNLLTVITGYSELLLQKIAQESPMHGEVEEIQRAAERAATLTRQLLAFSRKQIIEPKVLDLNHLMADLGKMLVRLIGENIDLKTVHGKGLGRVKVDPGQFEQILINLAVNARDAMPDGGTLLFETANVDLDEEYCAQRPYHIQPGRFVRLAVSDTGCGMTGETSKKIFEPFFTTKATGKGTGLGLSMIYGAVKQSGGSIEVYSEVGKGTTFKIYLPRVEGEAVRPEKDARPAVLPGGTETVLVVEDEEIVRYLCVRILERLGYKVLQARDGAEAIATAQGYGDRIDLLLTDVVMPGMNGSELATQLVLHHPEMKVLFTSGYTDDAIVRHGVLDEGVFFIGKPYTPLALARKVREVLDKAGR
jgi:two-component system cell cycle sensor histidine kinase/response regulator CckA